MRLLITLLVLSVVAGSLSAATIFFNNGTPNGALAAASRPAGTGVEIESADDFALGFPVSITGATFTGLLTGGTTPANVSNVIVEIYRVFPKDSDTVRIPAVPTRNNSPSDVEFVGRASGTDLTFSTSVLNPDFSATNSILNNISVNAGGEGPVRGQEVMFTVNFSPAILLPGDHYFFVPQVGLNTPNGQFYWLSSNLRPNPQVSPDLQSWIRNAPLDPDWLRMGTDVIGGTTPPTFNMVFTLSADVPEPATLSLFGVSLALFAIRKIRR
jgi:hypothetical protein